MSSDSNSNKPRHFDGFDFLRTFGVFSVIWIHVCDVSLALQRLNWINEYAVPVFIMMAVFLVFPVRVDTGFSTYNFLRKRAQRILYPLFVWTVLYLTARFLKSALFGSDSEIKLNFIGLAKGGASYHLWFLPAVFIYQCIALVFYLIYKNGHRVSFLVALALSFGGSILAVYLIDFSDISPGFDNRFIHYLPFVFVAVGLSCISFVGGAIRSLNVLIGLSVVFLIVSILCDLSYIAVLAYSALFFIIAIRAKVSSPRWLVSVSSYTMGVYLIHALVLEGGQVILSKLFGLTTLSPMIGVLFLLGVYVVSLACVMFLSKTVLSKPLGLRV